MADAFAALGVQRVIVTRLDATRRIGGVLSAIDNALLTLSHFSDSPFAGRGFSAFSPQEIAAKLLTRSTLSINAIAEATGFASPSHFSAAFTRRYEKPPARWQRQMSRQPELQSTS